MYDVDGMGKGIWWGWGGCLMCRLRFPVLAFSRDEFGGGGVRDGMAWATLSEERESE